MQRKLVKQGAGTLMVSLPSKWTKKHSLSKGDEVSIEETGNDILVSTSGGQAKRSTELELTNLAESSIRTLITSAYRSGYDKIVVRFKEEQQFQILQEVIKTRLIGFDITEKQAGFCIVENITEPAKEQYSTISHKVFQNIHILFQITKQRLRGQQAAESYEEVEERIQKYDNFCRRASLKQSDAKTEFLLTFFTLVIHGQRELYHLNKLAVKASADTLKLLDSCHELFTMLEAAYTKKDMKVLASVHELEKKLIYDEGYKALERAQPKERVIVYHVLAAIRQLYQANSPLTALLA